MLSKLVKEELLSGAYGLVQENIQLKEYTSFRIGGPCDLFIEPTSTKELVRSLRFLRTEKVPYYIFGNGSNILVKDGGFSGVVIKLGKQFSDCLIDGDRVQVQAGCLLSELAKKSFRAGLTGMEDLSGIPGSVGGGVVMNAGAYKQEMKDVVKSVLALDQNNQIVELSNEELDFSYRNSRLLREDMLVIEIIFQLKKGDPEAIQKRYEEVTFLRTSKQPLDRFSAGSTFKRPANGYASKLIDEAGLRGYTIGRAQVSEKHCGFLINMDEATAKDMLALIHYVQKVVKEKFQIDLEPEVRIIGEE